MGRSILRALSAAAVVMAAFAVTGTAASAITRPTVVTVDPSWSREVHLNVASPQVIVYPDLPPFLQIAVPFYCGSFIYDVPVYNVVISNTTIDSSPPDSPDEKVSVPCAALTWRAEDCLITGTRYSDVEVLGPGETYDFLPHFYVSVVACGGYGPNYEILSIGTVNAAEYMLFRSTGVTIVDRNPDVRILEWPTPGDAAIVQGLKHRRK